MFGFSFPLPAQARNGPATSAANWLQDCRLGCILQKLTNSMRPRRGRVYRKAYPWRRQPDPGNSRRTRRSSLDQALARMFPGFPKVGQSLAAKAPSGSMVRRSGLRTRDRENRHADPGRDRGTRPRAAGPDIVHEDEHLLVVNKPAGLVVHPGAEPAGTLMNGLLHHAPEPGAAPGRHHSPYRQGHQRPCSSPDPQRTPCSSACREGSRAATWPCAGY